MPRRDGHARTSWPILTLAVLAGLLLGLGRLPAWSAGPIAFLPPVPAPAFAAAPAFTPIPAPEPPPVRPVVRSPPRVRAAAAIVYHPETGDVLWASRGRAPRPIASITKVMTAMVLLETAPDLTRDVVVSASDVRRASTTYLRRGERVTLDGLLHLALIASDNVAARALARASGLGTRAFVDRMNRTAADLGLEHAHFVEPSGLDERNVATPFDVARLLAHAGASPVLSRIMRARWHELRTSRRGVAVRNTNRLLGGRYAVQAGKTGYIDEAGYCFGALVDVPGAGRVAVVVLGAGSNAGRFREVRRLADWASTTGAPPIADRFPAD